MSLSRLGAQVAAELNERRQRWEKKHGCVAHLAGLYLQLKPMALARGRFTAQRAAEIEDILAFPFGGDHSDAELEQVLAELLRLNDMEGVDRTLEILAG